MTIKLLLSLLTCTLFTRTSADGQETLQGAIPPDFKCQDCILVVIDPDEHGFRKGIEKQFKKYYTGKYEIVTAKKLETDSRFQDKKIYKFRLNNEIREYTQMVPDAVRGGMKESTRYQIRFCVYDRESEKQYPCFAEGRSSAESIERTAKMLDGANK